MTECEYQNRLSAWLDGELDQQSSQAVKRHLERCAACQEQVERLSAVYEFLAQDDALITDPFLATRVAALLKQRTEEKRAPAWLGRACASLVVAAGLLLGIGLGSGLYESLWSYNAVQTEERSDSGLWSESSSLAGQYAEAFRDGYAETGDNDE